MDSLSESGGIIAWAWGWCQMGVGANTVRPVLRNVIHVDYSTLLTLIRDQAGTINDASASFFRVPSYRRETIARSADG